MSPLLALFIAATPFASSAASAPRLASDGNSVTVPLSVNPACGVALVPATINGKSGTVCISIEVLDSVIFGNASEVGEPSDAEVKIGGFGLGRVSIGPPNTIPLGQQANAGVTGNIGFKALSQYSFGFDYRLGTLTLWKGATREGLLKWTRSADGSREAASLPYETRGVFPVVVHQAIGGKNLRLNLYSNQPFCMLASAAAGAAPSTDAPVRGRPDCIVAGDRLLKYAFPGGDTKGWTWIMVGDNALRTQTGIDGLMGLWSMDVSRVVIDPARHEVDYTIEPEADRFLGWLGQMIGPPLAVGPNGILWNPQDAWSWTIKGMPWPSSPDASPSGSFPLAAINGHKIGDLMGLYTSSRLSDGESLQAFIEEMYAADPRFLFGTDAKPVTYTINWK